MTIKEMAVVGVFAAVTAVMAQIAVPLPFTPVPLSFGVIAIYMSGMFLKPKHAFLAQVCYLMIGAAGVPVFANFRGGIGALLGPTGGYLLAYPALSFIVAFVLNRDASRLRQDAQNKKRLYLKAALAMLGAHLFFYACGTSWLAVTSGSSFQAALFMAVYPFIPLDVLKIVFCVFAVLPFRARLLAMNLLVLNDKEEACFMKSEDKQYAQK